jgi:hypothetical protein
VSHCGRIQDAPYPCLTDRGDQQDMYGGLSSDVCEGPTLPALTASSRARGMDPALVLP